MIIQIHMNKILYVVLLENNSTRVSEKMLPKFFVYYTTTECATSVMKEAEYLFEFPKLFSPVKIVETAWNVEALDVDKTVKKYMKKYGIDNVRGGSYTSVVLSDAQHKILKQELAFVTEHPSFPADVDENQVVPDSEPSNLYREEFMRNFMYQHLWGEYTNLATLAPQINELCENREKLRANLEKYRRFQDNKQMYYFNRNVVDKIDKLRLYMDSYSEVNYTAESSDTKKNMPGLEYTDILKYIQHAVQVVRTSHPVEYQAFIEHAQEIPEIYFYYPHFLLDNVFLHNKYSAHQLSCAKKLLETLEGMCYFVSNKIEELMFDLEHIPTDIHWKNEVVNYHISRTAYT